MKPEDLITTEPAKALLAGAAGGIVRWATLRSNWKEGCAAIFVGALCALYLGPIVDPVIEPVISKLAPNGDAGGLGAFIVGLGGISFSGVILDLVTAKFKRSGGEDGSN